MKIVEGTVAPLKKKRSKISKRAQDSIKRTTKRFAPALTRLASR